MKKLMIALMAVVAMTLMSSCGNSNLSDDPKDMVGQLTENLKAGDGNKFITMLGDVKTKAISLHRIPDSAIVLMRFIISIRIPAGTGI